MCVKPWLDPCPPVRTAAGVVAAAALIGLVLFPGDVHAHGGGAGLSQLPIWMSQVLLALAWLAYSLGSWVRRPRLAARFAFHAGMLVAALALFGPFDDWADASTAGHMAQHMLLIVVVAPLWVAGRPLAQWRAALGSAGDWWWRPLLRLTRHPGACAAIHAVFIWSWHAPGPYMAAVFNNWWHVLEHLCFVLSAWLFWWSVLRAGRRARLHASLALLFTLMHTGLLGAVLTFARTPLYFRESRDLWDQQLAGLIMWVPGGFAYLLAAGWCSYRWLSALSRAPRRRAADEARAF